MTKCNHRHIRVPTNLIDPGYLPTKFNEDDFGVISFDVSGECSPDIGNRTDNPPVQSRYKKVIKLMAECSKRILRVMKGLE